MCFTWRWLRSRETVNDHKNYIYASLCSQYFIWQGLKIILTMLIVATMLDIRSEILRAFLKEAPASNLINHPQ